MYNIKNSRENRDIKYLTKAMEYYRKKLFDATVTDTEFIISHSMLRELPLTEGQ